VEREESIWKDTTPTAKISAVTWVNDKQVAICNYNDRTRQFSEVDIVPGGEIGVTGAETHGVPVLISGWWYFPAERGGRQIRVRESDGKIERYSRSQPRIWAAEGAGEYIAYSDRDEENTHPILWRPTDGKVGHRYRKIIGIVSGLVQHGGQYVAVCMDGKVPGIEWQDGAFIPGKWVDAIEIGGELVAAHKDGTVRIVTGGKLGKVIGTTGGSKPQEIRPYKRGCALMSTTNRDALWFISLTEVSMIKAMSSDPVEPDNGSLFGVSHDVRGNKVAFGWTKGKNSGGAEVKILYLK